MQGICFLWIKRRLALTGSCRPITASYLAFKSRISFKIYDRLSELKFGGGGTKMGANVGPGSRAVSPQKMAVGIDWGGMEIGRYEKLSIRQFCRIIFKKRPRHRKTHFCILIELQLFVNDMVGWLIEMLKTLWRWKVGNVLYLIFLFFFRKLCSYTPLQICN